MLKHGEVTLGTHTVENHTADVDILAEIDKARNKCRHRIGRRLGINHQHDRQVKHSRNLGGRASVTIIAVEKAHHTFNNTHIGILAIKVKQFPHMPGRRHKSIEINARPATYRRMKLGVDIIRPALKRLNTIPLEGEQRHQSPSNRRLARATSRRRYHKSTSHSTYKGSVFIPNLHPSPLKEKSNKKMVG